MIEQNPNTIPPGWGEDSVTKYFETMRLNCFATFKYNRKFFDLIIEIDNIFNSIHQLPKAENDAPIFFFDIAHPSYLIAVQLASSGLVSETYMILRGMIEAALYGFYLYKKPELISVWLERHSSEDNKRELRNNIRIKEIIGLLTQTNQVVGDETNRVYEFYIDHGAHPNVRAMASKVTINSLVLLKGDPESIVLNLGSVAQGGILCLKIMQLISPVKFQEMHYDNKLEQLSKELHDLMRIACSADGPICQQTGGD